MIFGRKARVSSLDDVLDSSWKLLRRGAGSFKHPFHHPALTTMARGGPQVRTVILRGFSHEARTLICHCDVRSAKVGQIRENPRVSWLFYHPGQWIQLRLSGTASVHTDDDVAEAQWARVGPTSRINYCANLPPGSKVESPSSGLPDDLRNTAAKWFDKGTARKHFAAVTCRFDEMDWLMLKLTGNRRARFQWTDQGLDASWTVP